MNLTVKQPAVKKLGNGSAGQQSEPCPSFFRFFDTLRISSDPAATNRVAEWVESDYEIGRAFKDKLVPHAIRWFTGEAEDTEDFRSDDSGDAGEAAEELEAARLELALDAAVSASQSATQAP